MPAKEENLLILYQLFLPTLSQITALQNYDIIDNRPLGNSTGSFYNTWGLAFVLIFLFLFQLVFYFLALYTAGLFYGLPFSDVQNLIAEPDGSSLAINLARYTNFVSFTGYMFLPALLFGLINKTGIVGEGGLKVKIKPPLIFLALLILALAVPLVDYLTEVMHQFPFPQGLTYWATRMENSRNEMLNTILDMHRPVELLICLILIGLLPAFFEELMFRGVMLNIFKNITQKTWTPILLQSMVFTVLHFSFYEFPAIFLMGTLFGILAVKTGSIWYGVILHFLFNSVSVVLAYLNNIAFDKSGVFGEYKTLQINLILALASVAGLVILFRLFSKTQKTLNP